MERPMCQGQSKPGKFVCPCVRRATVERNGGWWCWQHDPARQTKSRAEAEAKKRLANAAPDMLAALEGVAVMLNTALREYEGEPWARRVRAALALVKEGK